MGRVSWPEWVEDPAFDVANQVRPASLPAPGGDTELLDWLGDFYSHRLDRAHPLWEITLLDGLEGGRWALACKVHHCLVDGVRGALVTSVLLDAERSRRPAPWGCSRRSARAGGRSGPVAAGAAGARRAGGRGRGASPRRLAGMLERCARARRLRRPRASRGRAALEPRRRRRATRRMATLTVPLADSKWSRTRSAAPSTTWCWPRAQAGCAHSWPAAASRSPAAGIRAQGPGRRCATRASCWRSATGMARCSWICPWTRARRFSRYRRTVERDQRLKAGRRRAGADTMVDLAGLVAAGARLAPGPALVRAGFNVTITNVPGARTPLYAFGARMQRAIPLVRSALAIP